MLSVASLLNPVRPEPRDTRLPSSPPSSLCTSSSTHGSPQLSTQPSSKKQKMTKDGAVFAKGKIKGEVNYPPFERLSEEMMREVQKFQVYPLGKIQEYCRHIPYNSEKKNFLEKTGRESFEVFQYIFKVPGDDKEYCVMWDYNIGLVRITPFFKCCKYSKTTPAKMLNMNPGLKEITHSITGGALAAQGYWMPWSCALAVCTTFCAHIAGALIPIFGPSFPSQCVPDEAPEHGRMIIDPQIIIEATAQAESYRLQYNNYPSKSSRESYSPQLPIRHEPMHMRNGNTPPYLGRSLRLKRTFGGDSPYGTATDTDMDTNGDTSSGERFSYSPVTPNSVSSSLSRPQTWQNHNMMAHSANSSINISPASPFKGPNPILSAIPRSSGLVDMQMNPGRWPISTTLLSHRPQNKRRVDEVDADDEYDGEEESGSITGTDDKGSIDEKISEKGCGEDFSMTGSSANDSVAGVVSSTNSQSRSGIAGGGIGGAEKKAAWLLMKLSVKDGESGLNLGLETAAREREAEADEGPRIKRRRATSM